MECMNKPIRLALPPSYVQYFESNKLMCFHFVSKYVANFKLVKKQNFTGLILILGM